MENNKSKNKLSITNQDNYNCNLTIQETYDTVRNYIVEAQGEIYKAVNSAMVIAYWNIGKKIYEVCGENDRASYGRQVLHYLSEKLSSEFGKGFDESNLRRMRKFFTLFPIRDALRPELSWTHYRSLMRVEDEAARKFYIEEAISCGWSSRNWTAKLIHFTISVYWQVKTKKAWQMK